MQEVHLVGLRVVEKKVAEALSILGDRILEQGHRIATTHRMDGDARALLLRPGVTFVEARDLLAGTVSVGEVHARVKVWPGHSLLGDLEDMESQCEEPAEPKQFAGRPSIPPASASASAGFSMQDSAPLDDAWANFKPSALPRGEELPQNQHQEQRYSWSSCGSKSLDSWSNWKPGQRSSWYENKKSSDLGRFHGTIKFFNPQKGYGFIVSPMLQGHGFHQDVYVPLSAGDFQAGQHVSFVAFKNLRGLPQAKDIVVNA